MGFLDELVKNAALWSAVQASKDENGNPDPYKAVGIAAGMGKFSLSDRARLGAMLGSQGAFDEDDAYYGTEDIYKYAAALEDYEKEKYSWRDDCEISLEYDVEPEDYDTLEEYEEALTEVKNELENSAEIEDGIAPKGEALLLSGDIKVPVTLKVSTSKGSTIEEARKSHEARREKYKWRQRYFRQYLYGLNVYEYETEEEFLKELTAAREEYAEMAKTDTNIYHYCGVVYEGNSYPYHYMTDDTSLKVGDLVVVPVGRQNIETIAEIVSMEEHTRLTVPYPVEKVKHIIRKYEPQNDAAILDSGGKKMSFRDEVKRIMKTPEEVAENERKEKIHEGMQYAQKDFKSLKDKIKSAAANGEAKYIDRKQVIQCDCYSVGLGMLTSCNNTNCCCKIEQGIACNIKNSTSYNAFKEEIERLTREEEIQIEFRAIFKDDDGSVTTFNIPGTCPELDHRNTCHLTRFGRFEKVIRCTYIL